MVASKKRKTRGPTINKAKIIGRFFPSGKFSLKMAVNPNKAIGLLFFVFSTPWCPAFLHQIDCFFPSKSVTALFSGTQKTWAFFWIQCLDIDLLLLAQSFKLIVRKAKN